VVRVGAETPGLGQVRRDEARLGELHGRWVGVREKPFTNRDAAGSLTSRPSSSIDTVIGARRPRPSTSSSSTVSGDFFMTTSLSTVLATTWPLTVAMNRSRASTLPNVRV